MNTYLFSWPLCCSLPTSTVWWWPCMGVRGVMVLIGNTKQAMRGEKWSCWNWTNLTSGYALCSQIVQRESQLVFWATFFVKWFGNYIQRMSFLYDNESSVYGMLTEDWKGYVQTLLEWPKTNCKTIFITSQNCLHLVQSEKSTRVYYLWIIWKYNFDLVDTPALCSWQRSDHHEWQLTYPWSSQSSHVGDNSRY